jgi:hypothetical protein
LNGNKFLEHNISLYQEGSGFFSGANRIQLIGKVTYSVVYDEDGFSLYSGSVENFVSFVADDSVTTSPRDNTEERLVSILADQIITNLIAQAS